MKVYKYRGGLQRDLESLKNNQFYAAQPCMLNDPIEMIFYSEKATREIKILKLLYANPKHSGDELDDALKNLEHIALKCGIFSLSQCHTNELLWAHYANSHQGFCIEYDLDLLVCAYKRHGNKLDFFPIEIAYLAHPDEADLKFSILENNDEKSLFKKFFGFKSKAWQYEQEIRIVTNRFGSFSYPFRAVRAIYFGVKIMPEQITEVMSTLQGRDISYYQMTVQSNSFQLIAIPITDQYASAEKYRHPIAPIAEGAICEDTLGQDYEAYKPYLYKIAEIARREPGCKIVITAARSTLSTPNAPVFYARYEDQIGNLMLTLTLTLEQIDQLYNQIDDL